jgi:hypothetical protein
MADWSFAFFVVALVVLCAGEPDVLDGLIKRANNVPVVCQPEKPADEVKP